MALAKSILGVFFYVSGVWFLRFHLIWFLNDVSGGSESICELGEGVGGGVLLCVFVRSKGSWRIILIVFLPHISDHGLLH